MESSPGGSNLHRWGCGVQNLHKLGDLFGGGRDYVVVEDALEVVVGGV